MSAPVRCILPVLVLLSLFPGRVAVALEAETAATSCLRCHAAMPERLGKPVAAWRESIHAENGVSCHNCHGGDPGLDGMEAMSPDAGFLGMPTQTEIPGFCGKCHAGVEEDYRASAHGQALGAGGPDCVTCHGNHAVQVATVELINSDLCGSCHAYERAETIKSALLQTDRTISALQQEIGRLHRIGIETDAMSNQLFALRNEFHRLFHSVDVQRVVAGTDAFQERLQVIAGKVAVWQEELAGRRRIGALAVAILSLAIVLTFLLRRTYKEEEQTEPGAGSRPL